MSTLRVERVRRHFDDRAQRALDRKRRDSLVASAREDLYRLTSSLTEKEAEIYRAELRRLLGPSSEVRAPALSAREFADTFFSFTKGRVA